MKKTLKSYNEGNCVLNLMTLPNSNFFKFEIVNLQGSDIERSYEKDIYGLSHFVEHLGFKSTRDYSTKELNYLIKNKGSYNASTDFSRINYFFKTSMENIELAFKLVHNYAFNDLKKITEEEFETEKKVIVNEINRYNDDDQSMFSFDVPKTIFDLHRNDNILGDAKVIETLQLQDAIELKSRFLKYPNHYNITYDSTILTEEEVISLFKQEHSRWSLDITLEEERSFLKHNEKAHLSDNTSEQSMTAITFSSTAKICTLNNALSYFARYANETSLNDLIRENNGLTYGIYFTDWIESFTNYCTFGCDVSKGTEKLLLELFNESINRTYNELTEEKYNDYVQTLKLKSTMNRLNLEYYSRLFNIIREYRDHFEENRNTLETDMDEYYNAINEISFNEFKETLKNICDIINNKKYSIVTNYKLD